MTEKLYRATRMQDGVTVVMTDMFGERPLPDRRDLYNHSPDGFEWGYGGSGPSQLALAICADALDDDNRAFRVYQDFKREIVAVADRAGFEISAERVRKICDEIEHIRSAP